MIENIDLRGTREERVEKLLSLAGWYKERRTSKTPIVNFYEKSNVELNEAALIFLEEYHGLLSSWYFSTRDIDSAADFDFTLYPMMGYDDGPFDYMYDDETGHLEAEEYSKVKTLAGNEVTLVGHIGYQYPARVWLGVSGEIYATHEYDDVVHKFSTVNDLIMHELSKTNIDILLFMK